MIDLEKYNYRTTWSHEEQNFVAEVAEFPYLRQSGKTPESAQESLRGVVQQTLADLEASGGVIPQPFPRPIPQGYHAQPYQYPHPQPNNFTMPHNSTAPAQGVSQSVNVNVGGPTVIGVRRGIGSGWHIVHLSLTALSCGLWAPVWIAHVIIDSMQNGR